MEAPTLAHAGLLAPLADEPVVPEPVDDPTLPIAGLTQSLLDFRQPELPPTTVRQYRAMRITTVGRGLVPAAEQPVRRIDDNLPLESSDLRERVVDGARRHCDEHDVCVRRVTAVLAELRHLMPGVPPPRSERRRALP